MPEYHLDTSLDQDRWNILDSFTQGYIEAMFFTECNPDDPELESATFADLSKTALLNIVAVCSDFQTRNAFLLDAATNNDHYDMNRAGNDFWYTRNHHGCGYWDRGLDKTGEMLTHIAHAYGECDLYMGDDEMLYVS